LPEPTCEVVDVFGSRLQVAAVQLAGEQLQLTTPGQVKLTLPWSALVRLDYASRNTRYLSDLEPQAEKYEPFFGNPVPAALALAGGVRRDVGFEQNPLTLGGQKFAKGLALRSRTLVTYRVPQGFRRLVGVAGIDDAVRPGGQALVRIKADDRTVWEQEVSGQSLPQPFELDVAGARRLEIVVDFGADQDIADHVVLADARLTR
jgi:hypothetical protein